MLPLIIAPNEALRRVATPIVLPPSKNVVGLGHEMEQAVIYYRGIGLAAPQVNKNERLIVVAVNGTLPLVCINPVIKKQSKELIDIEEGCLSIPGVFGIVERPIKVLASFVALTGETREEWLDGMLSRVFQHELDHLEGILFTDKTKSITSGQDLLEKYGLA